MIDFRYHLVSVIAVFLALAVGTALGSTMLQDPLLGSLKNETEQLRAQTERLRTDKDLADRLNDGGDHLVGAYAPQLLRGRLSGTSVAVVEAPGVGPRLREGVVERIEQAGGTVPGRVAVGAGFADPDESVFVRELADQLATGVELPRGSGYERAGALLGRALLRSEDGDGDGSGEPGSDSAAVLAGFAEAGLISVHGEPGGAADTAIVLVPGRPAAAGAGAGPPAGHGAVLDAAGGLHSVFGSAVLAGSPAAAGPGGLITRARSEQVAYTTVDAAGRAAGDVATVLAVAAAVDGRTGAFGIADGTEGFAPVADAPAPATESPARDGGPDPQPAPTPSAGPHPPPAAAE
ncbi:copper transporter [Streptomonospora sediminis]